MKSRAIDVRFLAATNRVLEAEVARGAFRQDLYYRLNGITLLIPPLRARVDEIEPLARTFARDRGEAGRPPDPHAAAGGAEAAAVVAWPGNIRELRNTIERALLLSNGDAITPEDLPLEKMRGTPVSMERVPEAAPRAAQTFPATALDEESRLDYERIVESLSLCSGNQTRAAKLLGHVPAHLLRPPQGLQHPAPPRRRLARLAARTRVARYLENTTRAPRLRRGAD